MNTSLDPSRFEERGAICIFTIDGTIHVAAAIRSLPTMADIVEQICGTGLLGGFWNQLISPGNCRGIAKNHQSTI